jgi:hypothetical protein
MKWLMVGFAAVAAWLLTMYIAMGVIVDDTNPFD